MKKCFFIFFIFFVAQAVNALTVRSASHTDWSNASTWSTGQVPSNPDSIIISHYVTITADLTINAPTVLVIENTGTLCGDHLLNISCGSEWYNYGSVFINRFVVRTGSNYCTITTKGTNTISGCSSGSWSVVPPKGNVNMVPWTACKSPSTNWEPSNVILGGCTVGIKEYFNSNSLSVYPNPVDDKLTVEYKGKGSYYFMIKDVSGREVKKGSVSRLQSEELDFSDLKAGIYFIEFREGDNTLIKKIIKQ